MEKKKIVSIADIQTENQNALDAKRHGYEAAAEHCNNEIAELTDYVEKFCNAIDSRYIISNSFSIGNAIRECFMAIRDSYLEPIINGNEEMKQKLGYNEYTKMRIEIYNDIIEQMKDKGLIE